MPRKVCRRKVRKERHPQTCTYFARNNMCRYKAFKHIPNKLPKKFEDIEKEVDILKAEIG